MGTDQDPKKHKGSKNAGWPRGGALVTSQNFLLLENKSGRWKETFKVPETPARKQK